MTWGMQRAYLNPAASRAKRPTSVMIVAERPNILLIGDGRLARHLRRYFQQLNLSHAIWSRRMAAEETSPALGVLVQLDTRVLLAISDSAVDPFIRSHPELGKAVRVHFLGCLAR